MRKNVPIGGTLTLDIKLSNYAKALAVQGELKEVFPDTPADETNNLVFKSYTVIGRPYAST